MWGHKAPYTAKLRKNSERNGLQSRFFDELRRAADETATENNETPRSGPAAAGLLWDYVQRYGILYGALWDYLKNQMNGAMKSALTSVSPVNMAIVSQTISSIIRVPTPKYSHRLTLDFFLPSKDLSGAMNPGSSFSRISSMRSSRVFILFDIVESIKFTSITPQPPGKLTGRPCLVTLSDEEKRRAVIDLAPVGD